ncbi:hypothetical protein K490DRAFT_69309 [Saccharata proteae CBS 121410]|uniref:F-box domain-containing protein n=1 Tax=Saccharata proteae CBS 121410 TaxID=1314787 RepID=A0A9P4HQT2_9PEZI|nr:hypothetical protein K490DRAFT_69309 [Saccharata proteae CBS 121410]
MSSMQRRKSIEPGTAASRAADNLKLAGSPSCSTMPDSQKSSRIQNAEGLSTLEPAYVVPPMSSVSVDPPIPAETDSRSAQDQHPMRTNLPLLSQPLLPASTSHAATITQRAERSPSPPWRLLEALPSLEDLPPGYFLNPREPAPSPPCDSNARVTLLTLPPEIRHLIYLQLPYMQNSQPLIYGLSIFKDRKQHPLASICRQIRAEALALFYSTNTWLISLEHKDFYDAFVRWITALPDPHANALRLLKVRVLGRAFSRPRQQREDVFAWPLTGALATVLPAVQPTQRRDDLETAAYGCATFSVDLSERWLGGKVKLVSCDGPWDVGLLAEKRLSEVVYDLWRKKKEGRMTGREVKDGMETFLTYTGWWL